MAAKETRKYAKKDLWQAGISVWLVVLAILFFGPRKEFYEFLILSLIAVALAFSLYITVRKRRFNFLYNNLSKEEILTSLKRMNADEFEDFVTDLFLRLGYKSERVGNTRESVINIVAEKENDKYGIHCLSYNNAQTEKQEIEEFCQKTKNTLLVGKKILISRGTFSEATKEQSKKFLFNLFAGNDLVALIVAISHNQGNLFFRKHLMIENEN